MNPRGGCRVYAITATWPLHTYSSIGWLGQVWRGNCCDKTVPGHIGLVFTGLSSKDVDEIRALNEQTRQRIRTDEPILVFDIARMRPTAFHTLRYYPWVSATSRSVHELINLTEDQRYGILDACIGCVFYGAFKYNSCAYFDGCTPSCAPASSTCLQINEGHCTALFMRLVRHGLDQSPHNHRRLHHPRECCAHGNGSERCDVSDSSFSPEDAILALHNARYTNLLPRSTESLIRDDVPSAYRSLRTGAQPLYISR